MIVRRNLRNFINFMMLVTVMHCGICFFMSLFTYMDSSFYYAVALLACLPCALVFSAKRLCKNFFSFLLTYLVLFLMVIFLPLPVALKVVLCSSTVVTATIHYTRTTKNPDNFNMSLFVCAFFIVFFIMAINLKRSELLMNICFFELIIYTFLFLFLKGIIKADEFLLSNCDETVTANLSRIHRITNGISFLFAFISFFSMSLLAFVGNKPILSFGYTAPDPSHPLNMRSMTAEISQSPIKRWARSGLTSVNMPDSAINLIEYTVLILLSAAVFIIIFKAIIRIIRTFNASQKEAMVAYEDRVSFIPLNDNEKNNHHHQRNHERFFTNEAKFRKIYKKYVLKHRSAPASSLTPSEIMQGIEENFVVPEITELYEKVRFGPGGCSASDIEKMKEITRSKTD